MAQIDEEINDLLSKVGSANSILMKYINDKVSELDAERQTLQEEIISLTCSKTESKMGQITDHVKKWQDISFEDKQAVVDALIKVIKVANGNIKSHGKSKAVIAAVIFEVNLLQSSRFGEALRSVQDDLESRNSMRSIRALTRRYPVRSAK